MFITGCDKVLITQVTHQTLIEYFKMYVLIINKIYEDSMKRKFPIMPPNTLS